MELKKYRRLPLFLFEYNHDSDMLKIKGVICGYQMEEKNPNMRLTVNPDDIFIQKT